jgi:hypothetical protein
MFIWFEYEVRLFLRQKEVDLADWFDNEKWLCSLDKINICLSLPRAAMVYAYCPGIISCPSSLFIWWIISID